MNSKTHVPSVASKATAVICLGVAGCAPVSQQTPETDGVSGQPWELVWHDEFSGTELDRQKWNIEKNCWGGGNNEQQCYTDSNENIQLTGGKLHIVARKQQASGPKLNEDHPDYKADETRSLPYTSARLRSKNKGDWRYGRFEIRAKLPSGQGTWPAIWMLPTDWKYGRWAASGEIDIMEAVNLGTPRHDTSDALKLPETRVHGTLHYGGQAPENVYAGTPFEFPQGVNPADDFHVYALEWQAGEIRWYVDGKHYATQTSETWYTQPQTQQGDSQHVGPFAPFDQRFHMLLNLAVGGAWPENTNQRGIDESVFPQHFVIDYVRVYQCTVDPQNGRGCETREPSAKLVTEEVVPNAL